LGKKNVPNLLGEGVEQEVLTDIIKIMKKNPYLLEIKNEKAVFIGT
jgi:divalent metal cation (Fe/Co/Zn/Cd) transporter